MICISSCNFLNTLSISWLLILYLITWLKPFIIKYKDRMIFVFGLVHRWNMMAPPKQLIKSRWFRHQIACLRSQMVKKEKKKKRGQRNRGAYSSGHSLPLHGLNEKVYHQIVMRFCFKSCRTIWNLRVGCLNSAALTSYDVANKYILIKNIIGNCMT